MSGYHHFSGLFVCTQGSTRQTKAHIEEFKGYLEGLVQFYSSCLLIHTIHDLESLILWLHLSLHHRDSEFHIQLYYHNCCGWAEKHLEMCSSCCYEQPVDYHGVCHHSSFQGEPRYNWEHAHCPSPATSTFSWTELALLQRSELQLRARLCTQHSVTWRIKADLLHLWLKIWSNWSWWFILEELL